MHIYGGMMMTATGRIGFSYTHQTGYNVSRKHSRIDTIHQPAAARAPESAETGKYGKYQYSSNHFAIAQSDERRAGALQAALNCAIRYARLWRFA
jgi:hypothetical protein